MAKTFHLTIARIGENLFEGEAVSATFPGEEGVFTVLAGHEPFVSALKSGEIHIVSADGEKHCFVSGQAGVAEISSNQTTVLL
jgi:F-type H+-transporting ATPase subunit epsilon